MRWSRRRLRIRVKPGGVDEMPVASFTKEPARVSSDRLSWSETTKEPTPLMARSVEEVVKHGLRGDGVSQMTSGSRPCLGAAFLSAPTTPSPIWAEAQDLTLNPRIGVPAPPGNPRSADASIKG